MSEDAIPLRPDCVACRAAAAEVSGETQTAILLGMAASGKHPVASIIFDLCPLHLEQARGACAAIREGAD